MTDDPADVIHPEDVDLDMDTTQWALGPVALDVGRCRALGWSTRQIKDFICVVGTLTQRTSRLAGARDGRTQKCSYCQTWATKVDDLGICDVCLP